MGDLAVHGVVVGRTGSGKSVFLNNLIFNMLTEYAPWELDLYLADFKKVELSRYMSKYKTPHLKTCAATSEIRYVITMLSHIVDCMQARQDLFTRLGIQKISEFRKKYNVVLPRVVLLIDEFQQMFQEATNRESVIIDDLLMSIIKLGRATGFHLLFASQEMSGALSGKALANFKIRFALPCDSSVSADILGNTAAASLERGFVLVNTDSGKENQNKKYKVPFIPDDEEIQPDGTIKESYFYKVLREYVTEADSFSFEKNKTFYQEDAQAEIEELENLLDNKRVKEKKASQLAGSRYFDIFTLGNGVVYSDKKFDMETFFLEKGRNKNIFVICPDVDDLAYVQKMLAVNFKHSTVEKTKHFYYDFNPILSAKYQIQTDLPTVQTLEMQEQLEAINKKYVSRVAIIEAAKQRSVEKFIEVFYDKSIEGLGNKDRYLNAKEKTLEIFQGTQIADILTVANEKLSEDRRYMGYVEPLIKFYKHEMENVEWDEMFPPIVYWISGVGSMRKQLISQWIEEGESLHSFAEDVYMGEESEAAVKRIENSLEEIFIGCNSDELVDLEFLGDPNATREDFDDAVRCFEAFAQEIERIRENNSDYFETKAEDNELYRFLIPVIESIAVGVSTFSSAAKTELDRLGDNYQERMDSAKQRVEEAKKEKAPIDFDLDLFDFDDDFTLSAGRVSGTSAPNDDIVQIESIDERSIRIQNELFHMLKMKMHIILANLKTIHILIKLMQ